MEIMNNKREKATNRVGTKAYNELLKIAKETNLMPEDRTTLDTLNSDSADFFNTAVWVVNESLQRAYELGLRHGNKGVK